MQQVRQLNTIKCVLFDLDGTLIDTAPDMVAALNTLLIENELNPLPFTDVRNSVSKGSLALIKLGFGENLDAEQLADLQKQYLNTYSKSLCVDSSPFTGIQELLNTLDAQKICWGIVTNKPGWLAEPLLKELDLLERSQCLISGDTLPRRKPHPDPLLHASRLLQQSTGECVYIGDDQRDIDAGNAAGMQTLIAGYGYIGANETPANWGADAMVNQVCELSEWLTQRLAKK